MSQTTFKQCSRSLLNAVRKQSPSRTPNFLVTVFGDTIQSHGGEIWLGSLIGLMEPFGINERLVRTSVYRLTQEGWLTSTKVGRRSYYRLSEEAASSVDQAEKRIYYYPDKSWDNEWCLIFTGTAGTTPEQRAELRKRLAWLGFGVIAPNVFGHPAASLEPIWSLLEELGVSNKIVVMRAKNFDKEHSLNSHEMVQQCFKLNDLEKEYRTFIKRYQRLSTCLGETRGLNEANPEHCFIIRSLLVHHYRRILLRDPQLPHSLLPKAWAGNSAQQLCASIYKAISPLAEEHIMAQCENQAGPFRAITKSYQKRFSC